MEETRECKKCKIVKSIKEFRSKTVKNNTWYERKCKQCNALEQREKKQLMKKNNPDQYENERIKARERDRKTYKIKGDIIKARNNKYYEKNKNKIHESRKQYRKNNKEKVKKWKNKYRDSIDGRLSMNLRGRVRREIGTGKEWLELLDCHIDNLRNWFQYNFDLDEHCNMNWNNYGKVWEIDHVIPCKSFNLQDKEQRKKCFHWKNTLPVLKEYNKSKNDKIKMSDILKLELRLKLFEKKNIINSL